MNFPQFATTLVLSVAFAILAVWNASATKTNVGLATQQSELQAKIEKAQMQQKILERLLQRTAVVGSESKDAELIGLLGRYGLTIKNQAPVK